MFIVRSVYRVGRFIKLDRILVRYLNHRLNPTLNYLLRFNKEHYIKKNY